MGWKACRDRRFLNERKMKNMKKKQSVKHNLVIRSLLQAGIVVSIAGLTGCAGPKVAVGPPLERVVQWDENPTYRVSSEEAVIEWLNRDTPSVIVSTPEERWANGLAACMTPFMVDWANSKATESDDGYVLVQNVQVGGNPIVGVSRHATVRIPARGIERVEFVIVRYHLSGVGKSSGHIQLRFVFKEDRRPELLTPDGELDPMQPYLDDLLISWEAWRPTNTPWKFVEGMEPDSYTLTPKMYAGSQRFLNDSLRGAVWDCYPIQLPDIEEAADMVFYCGLVMGDVLSRRLVPEMLKKDLSMISEVPLASRLTGPEVERAKARLDWDVIPDHMFKDVVEDDDLSYHSIERSCISVALFNIELAMQRLYEKYDLGERKSIACAPDKLPKWFDDLMEGRTWAATVDAAPALYWLMKNSSVLPYEAYLPLKEADMIQTDSKGKMIMYRYGHEIGTPYGKLSRNLM